MYYPDKKLFREKARQGNLVPVYAEVIADLETPVSAFLKLESSPYSFLLESVEPGAGIGRYSFLGGNPSLVLKSRGGQVEISERGRTRKVRTENPLMFLKGVLENYRPVPDETLPPFSGGAVGYVSYDCARYFENLPSGKLDELGLPELCFMVADTLLIFDRLTNKIKIVANAHIEADPDRAYSEAVSRIETLLGRLLGTAPGSYFHPRPGRAGGELKSRTRQKDFERSVLAAQEYIRAGEILQVVISQRFEAPLSAPPFNIYRALRTINPSPYMFFLRFDDLHLVGSSPEIMVQAADGEARLRPIAGTRPRGISRLEDERLEAELLADPKELAEHVMLVDLGRNDLGRVSVPGSIRVGEMMSIERYSHVMHIVSDLRGKLAEGRDAYDAFAASFPAGTVSGAPKIRAMEIIDELEPFRRGPYGGAVGYFSFDGNLDSCILIRTIIVKDNTAYIQAGAGIVADSVPEREHRECLNKARALFGAVKMAEGGLT